MFATLVDEVERLRAILGKVKHHGNGREIEKLANQRRSAGLSSMERMWTSFCARALTKSPTGLGKYLFFFVRLQRQVTVNP